MPSVGSKHSKPKASEIASEARKVYIPYIRQSLLDRWPTYSYLYRQPLMQLNFEAAPRVNTAAPSIFVTTGDPVDYAINWSDQCGGQKFAFICAANDKRPGGDWETGVIGYEEKLCRRSTLSATLATPGPNSYEKSHYPLPIEGGIFSPYVVVFRGPHDRYEKLSTESWTDLPVCSVAPIKWPKLNQNGTKFSFAEEREIVMNKLRAALRICASKGYTGVVIGDFGLGQGCRNPPRELAEMWREVLLWDPEVRGRILYVAFVFTDATTSTTKLILEDIAKKGKNGTKGKSKSSSSSSSSSSSHSSVSGPTDQQVFEAVFSPAEVQRVLTVPDPRYGLSSIMG